MTKLHILIVGVGAIGRQVALQLAAVGVPDLVIMDDDVVGVENLAAQGYSESDIGYRKVDATRLACHRVNDMVKIQAVDDRFKRSWFDEWVEATDLLDDIVVFSCVDNMESRQLIWDSSVNQSIDLFIDARMSAEVIRWLAVASTTEDGCYYDSTLFNDDQAYQDTCTARTTIYTANIAAGLMIGQMTKWMRGFPVDHDLMLNLLSGELINLYRLNSNKKE